MPGLNDGPDEGCEGGVAVNVGDGAGNVLESLEGVGFGFDQLNVGAGLDAPGDCEDAAGNVFGLLEEVGVGFNQLKVGNEFEAPNDRPPTRTDVAGARLGKGFDGGWLGAVTP